MAVLLSPPYLQFLDDSGQPLAGGLVYTYAAGTTTPKAAFTDATGTTPLANPIVLDAAGRATIWIDGSYNIEVRTSANVLVRNTANITAFINNTTGGTTLTNTTLNNPTISGGTADNVVIGNTTPNTINGTLITASQGVSPGNTANASATVLDWYQEGTFTPTSYGATTAGTATYTQQSGRFTRIGNCVYFRIYLGWSAHTGTGTLNIGGLPFTSESVFAALSVYYSGLVVATGKQLTALVQPNTTNISLYASDPAGTAIAFVNMDTAVPELVLSGAYFV